MKVFLCVLLFAVPAFSQLVKYRDAQPCELTLKDSPLVRGFRLGMERVETYKSLPDGERILNENDLKKRPGFEGVRTFEVEFVDDKVSLIDISYPRTFVWDTAQEFATNISTKFNLPVEPWTYPSVFVKGRLECKEFVVEVDSIKNSITLTNLLALKAVELERILEDRAKKKAFKP